MPARVGGFGVPHKVELTARNCSCSYGGRQRVRNVYFNG